VTPGLVGRLRRPGAITPRGRHLLAYDVVAIAISIAVAFALRFDASNIVATISPYLPVALLPLIVLPPIFAAFGLYRREWRYASVNEMFALAGAVVAGMVLCFAVFLLLSAAELAGAVGFPRLVWVNEGLLILALVGGGRFVLRAGLERRGQSGGTDQERGAARTIVYGAGETGATVARVAARDPAAALTIVGFIDDDPQKRSSRLLGKPVFGGLADLEAAVTRTGARQLLLAMPMAPGAAIRRAFEEGRRLGLEVRTVPPARELLSGEIRLAAVRRVSVEDLLRRAPVAIDVDAVAGYLNGASVMVTGGAGSIGAELVRQILELGPRALIVLDNHEEGLWAIEREVSERLTGNPGVQFRPVLADVRSRPAVETVILEARPDVVFHAAALKHVPIVETFPSEGVMTNIVGTHNLLRACEAAQVPRFVLISTDKAVDPVGVMGATKRLAEQITVASAQRTGRPYVAVRFGNVLGSSGSVILTFQQQLARGQALTITHPDVTRFFMTIGEAVSLILEAASSPSTGDIFVLDMGDPVRIVDLAHDLVRLSGLEPERVPIVYTGLRAGERLHESLFYDHETTEATVHQGILRVRALAAVSGSELEVLVDRLSILARERDDRGVRELLRAARAYGVPLATTVERPSAPIPADP
jgi:FlaA1/EpsC-like NDP-sugar epimerase